MTDVWYLSRGDTGPVLTGTLEYQDPNGNWLAQDLTGATVTLSLYRANGSAYKTGLPVTITSRTSGEISYAWGPSDSSQGLLTGKFCAIWTGPPAAQISFPNTGRFQIRVSQ